MELVSKLAPNSNWKQSN